MDLIVSNPIIERGVKMKLVIITGISASGKTTLSHKISNKPFSFDNYKILFYEKYGFTSEEERKRLWSLAKQAFIKDLELNLFNNLDTVIEYAFDSSWQSIFNNLKDKYNCDLIVINCNTRDFDDIWESRCSRDSNILVRHKSLTASAYIKDKLYISNGKLNLKYKEIKRKEYLNSKYTSLKGDRDYTDIEILNIIRECDGNLMSVL